MPTQIHNPRLGARERYFARQSVYRLAKQTLQTEVIQAPFFGWVPDLPSHVAGWKGYASGHGLAPLPHPSAGLCLRNDDGYARIDPVRLPLGHVASPPGLYAITMLAQLVNNLNVPQRLAVVASDGTTPPDIYVGRIDPVTGQWGEVLANAFCTNQAGSREAIYDHCVFPFGAPTRIAAKYAVNPPAGAITTPIMIFCAANATGPVGNVLIYPDATPGRYDELTRWAFYPGTIFGAASCETFNGRVHFLHTYETSAAGQLYFRQRHRWTAVGTADPDETIVGSGYLDLAEFQRGGLRIESMQDKLALYFGDGVAFQVPTGFYADAYRPQIVSRSRGLIGGQALCTVTPHLHFGIFNDGWWTLDSSGRWSEVGRLILEESGGKSHEITKWKDSFYEDLNTTYAHRTVCVYDKYRKMVRIAYPSRSESNSENYRVLNYHLPTDTCWRDRYAQPVTAWGTYDIQTRAGVTWDGLTALGWTWDDLSARELSWDDLSAQYRNEVVVHGTGPINPGTSLDGGHVFYKDNNLITYDGVQPTYSYITHEYNKSGDPLTMQTFHTLGLEYVNVGGSAVSAVVSTDNMGNFQFANIPTSEGLPGQIHTGYSMFRLNGNELGLRLYGSGPVAIRSIISKILLYGTSEREGQV